MLNFPLSLTTLLTLMGLNRSYGASSDLDAVVVVFRHGDRTPINPYPNDPYRNRSYWPVDWGMLTNVGKQRHYALGQYFRKRYQDFLPEVYSEKDIYVRSTDVDRTLMSAASNLAGLYPPMGSDVWKQDLAWQPIPIHTIPEKLDALLAAKKPCKKYDLLYKKLFQSEYFVNISHINHDLYAYLTRYSGMTINDLRRLDYLYNDMQIEVWNNYTLPDWAQKVFPDKLRKWAALSFATSTFTPELARLKTGPFFHNLIQHFKNRTETPKGAQYYAPKFIMFSAHDNTIANLLNSMGAFDYHCPPYTSTIIFELHKRTENSSYVNVFYKNTTEARSIKIGNCETDCDFKSFQHILSPIALSLDQWETECNTGSLFDNSLDFFALAGILFFSVCCIGCLFLFAMKRVQIANRNLYSQLPDEENA
ncbi:prostatic acid phosphatase-like [Euwallacea fornicatus]|uniref:prostatic acid phosphatase-like n=1 Tax=Euwallacea fornicatus TaxID=995702 RepID=UPI00338DB98E